METKNLNYTAEEIGALLEKIENLPTIPSFHEFSFDVYGLNDSQSSGQIQSIIEADSGSWNNFLSNCLKNVLKIKCASSGTGGFYPCSRRWQCDRLFQGHWLWCCQSLDRCVELFPEEKNSNRLPSYWRDPYHRSLRQ